MPQEPHLNDESVISSAAELLLAGKLVAIPTETVYGLACDATNDAAVERVYRVKGRPSHNPLILHFDSLASALPYIAMDRFPDPAAAHRKIDLLAKEFWPGPLSIIVPRGHGIADAACGGGDTIAIRIPRHPLTQAILARVSRPVAAPSANPSAYISPTTAHHVRASLGAAIDLVVDGGPCEVGLESTVLSLVGPTPSVLRPGYVSGERLSAILGEQVEETAQQDLTGPLLSPGMLRKHYSPRTPVALLPSIKAGDTLPPNRGAILFSQRALPLEFGVVRTLSETGELAEVAALLFASLRELDQLNLDLIVVDTCEPRGLGTAIMDRLIRAVAKLE